MDFQKLLTDAQAKADANGDSKLTADDIQALASQYGLDQSLVDGLKLASLILGASQNRRRAC